MASAANTLQNGSHKDKRNGLYKQGDVIEMGNLGGSPIKRARLQPSVEVRPALFARKCLFIFTILMVGALVIALSVGLPGLQVHIINNSTWTKLFDEYGKIIINTAFNNTIRLQIGAVVWAPEISIRMVKKFKIFRSAVMITYYVNSVWYRSISPMVISQSVTFLHHLK